MTQKGLFITFEGGEGSGKTTQINWLAEFIKDQNRKVITTREPGGTPESEKIRNLLVQRSGGDWGAMAEALMMYAARAIHTDKVIKPALKEGKVIISDRYSDSSIAYQGAGRDLGVDKVKELESYVLSDFKPDITIILDIDPKVGLERSNRRLATESLGLKQTEDRFENLDISFHEKLRAAFLQIAKDEPDRCHVINADQSPQVIREQIQKIIGEALSA